MLVLSLLAKAEASPWTEAGARKRFPSKGTLLYITNAYFYFRYLTFVKKKSGNSGPFGHRSTPVPQQSFAQTEWHGVAGIVTPVWSRAGRGKSTPELGAGTAFTKQWQEFETHCCNETMIRLFAPGGSAHICSH